MSLINTTNLSFDYIKRDEDGNVEGIIRAVDDVNIEVKAGEFIAILSPKFRCIKLLEDNSGTGRFLPNIVTA